MVTTVLQSRFGVVRFKIVFGSSVFWLKQQAAGGFGLESLVLRSILAQVCFGSSNQTDQGQRIAGHEKRLSDIARRAGSPVKLDSCRLFLGWFDFKASLLPVGFSAWFRVSQGRSLLWSGCSL